MRPRNAIILVVALTLAGIGWFGLEVWRVHTADPNPVIDYRERLRALSLKTREVASLERAESAWRAMRAAAQQVDRARMRLQTELTDEGHPPRRGSFTITVDLSLILKSSDGADLEPERRLLAAIDQAGIWDRVAAFAENAPGVRSARIEGPLFLEPLDELGEARTLSEARLAAMTVALGEGSEDDLVKGIDETLAIAQTIALQPSVTNWFIGAGIQSKALAQMRFALGERFFSRETLRRLDEVLVQRRLPPLRMALEGERLILHDLIQRGFTDDGDGDGYLIPRAFFNASGVSNPASQQLGIIASARARFRLATRRAFTQEVDRRLDVISDFLEQGRVHPADRQFPWEKAEPDADLFLVPLLVTPLERTITYECVAEMEHRGSQLMIAVEAYRADHGDYPERLQDLIPARLSRVPRSPAPWTALRLCPRRRGSLRPALPSLFTRLGRGGSRRL